MPCEGRSNPRARSRDCWLSADAAIAVTLVLGAAGFCALGVAVASLIRNSEAAPPVVQLILFPLVFISGTYMPIHSAMLNRISGALPVRPAAVTSPSR